MGVFFRVDNISLVPNQRDSLRDTVGCDSVWEEGGMDIGSRAVNRTRGMCLLLLWDDGNAILFKVPCSMELLRFVTWCANDYAS